MAYLVLRCVRCESGLARMRPDVGCSMDVGKTWQTSHRALHDAVPGVKYWSVVRAMQPGLEHKSSMVTGH